MILLHPGHRQISIHAPHEGERPVRYCTDSAARGFQSTLPTRGSDRALSGALAVPLEFQSTLPTRGSDDKGTAHTKQGHPFQSTLPTRGSDSNKRIFDFVPCDFNPRSPRGGATGKVLHGFSGKGISIHAPHEGERLCMASMPSTYIYFNPRSPRGGATR